MCDGCQEFFKKHAGVVKAAALAHASAFVDYADLAQMVFVKVLEWKQKQIDPIEISPGFLYTIASNLAISEWRKRNWNRNTSTFMKTALILIRKKIQRSKSWWIK